VRQRMFQTDYDINTAGQGFATDAVIATIPVQSDPTLEYLDDLMDIKVANYPAARMTLW